VVGHWPPRNLERYIIDTRFLIGIGNGIIRPVYYLYIWRHWWETKHVSPVTALKGAKW